MHAKNGGESGIRMVTRNRVDGELGGLHTHPDNGMPSSDDVILLLHSGNVAEFVITPYRTIVLFRTNQTRTFSNRFVAKGYLKGMNINKGKDKGKDGWPLDYKDLSELHILAYEAERNSDIFVRKNKAK